MTTLLRTVSWTRLMASVILGALLGTLLGKAIISRVIGMLERRNAALREELYQYRKYSRSRDPFTEAIVDEACSRHPELTREEARREIEEAGF